MCTALEGVSRRLPLRAGQQRRSACVDLLHGVMADAKALLEAFWSVGRAMALAQGGVGGAEEVFEPRVGSASSVSGR